MVGRKRNDDDCEKRKQVLSSRLKQVLDEDFLGNADLMAFVAGVNLNTLNAWLNGKRVPQSGKLFDLSKVLNIDESWLDGSSNSRVVANQNQTVLSSNYYQVSPSGIFYSELHGLSEREFWLKRELVKVNALQEEKRKQIKEQTYTEQSEDCHDKDEYDALMEKLKQAADRLGYRERLAMMVFNAVLRFESTNGKLEETPRSLWGGIRGLGKKSVELLYEAFPEK